MKDLAVRQSDVLAPPRMSELRAHRFGTLFARACHLNGGNVGLRSIGQAWE